MTLEEIGHFAALVVSLRRVVNPKLGLSGDVLTDLRDREYYLLHRSVVSNNLHTDGTY